ncbi:AAA family ATPase [Kribbella sandramycini]|uniref:AAA family ATPase n=1 Tax=Kribbella sandramycini TaxID=60450 RepID=A0A7Y4KVE7_9ACTN|nr:AAA family ATPase [Kribbella sandramycini]MBB6567978.1 putative kinase [Kribbella sandramycini]NOL39428.1 AAA family ATPase [Kribbella sandramycini]
MFLLQMSGLPGAGKSTIARHVATTHRAIVVDYDILKSTLLDTGFDFPASTRAAYALMYAEARHLLTQGHPVVMDSPCFWPQILTTGQQIAATHNVPYKYIECHLTDLDLPDERLRTRPTLRSQRPSLTQAPADAPNPPTDPQTFIRTSTNQTQRPTNPLHLNTRHPLPHLLPQVDAYLKP